MTYVLRLRQVLPICGLIAGLFYIIVSFIQALTRPGFDILRHDVSLLANGTLGWIQITNFVLSGLLILAFAVGMRLILRGSQGGTSTVWRLRIRLDRCWLLHG